MENEVMNVEVVENNEVMEETTDLVPTEVPEVVTCEEVSKKDMVLVGGLLTLAGVGAVALIKGGYKLAKTGIQKIKDKKAQKVTAAAVNVPVMDLESEPIVEEPEQTSSEDETTEE